MEIYDLIFIINLMYKLPRFEYWIRVEIKINPFQKNRSRIMEIEISKKKIIIIIKVRIQNYL